jgi:4-amino-4-deoxy-L-arabinose transferase
VCASFWAYSESINDKRILWILLIGFFAGCAVLNKWLTGILIFAGWGFNILLSIKNKEVKQEIFRFIIAFIICLIVFVPWQIYILKTFPVEANYEYAYNSQHVFKPIENHGGDYLFYYHKLRQYFGLFTWQIVLVGAVIFTFSKTESKKIKWALGISFLIVFLFFSLVVKTKMQSYLFVVGPIGYIFMAFAIVKIIRVFKLPGHFSTAIISVCLFTCSFFLLNYDGIVSYFHNSTDPERIAKIHNTAIYKDLHSYIRPNTKYILNLSQFSEVELMFYNKDVSACHGNIDKASLDILLSKKFPVGVFKNHSRYTDEDLIKQSPLFYKIDKDLGNL